MNKLPKIIYINLALLILVLISGGIYLAKKNLWNAKSPDSEIKASDLRSAVSLQRAFRNVYKKAQGSVVSIRTFARKEVTSPDQGTAVFDEPRGIGSGFFIGSTGLIITNFHVIRDGNLYEIITPEGDREFASYEGSHERADIAVLRIIPKKRIRSLEFSDSSQVEVGDWSIAIGSPFGLEKTFTVGVVSARSREDMEETGQSHIQTDAAINPGNSGGPLLNIYGKVIGINQRLRSTSGGNEGIGFAIPSNYVIQILEQIRKNPGVHIRPAILGIKAAPIQAEWKRILGVKKESEGLLIFEIELLSSAGLAGLRRYDLIVEANGNKIERLQDLREQIGIVGLGGKLNLKIIRAGKEMSFPVRLITGKR